MPPGSSADKATQKLVPEKDALGRDSLSRRVQIDTGLQDWRTLRKKNELKAFPHL